MKKLFKYINSLSSWQVACYFMGISTLGLLQIFEGIGIYYFFSHNFIANVLINHFIGAGFIIIWISFLLFMFYIPKMVKEIWRLDLK